MNKILVAVFDTETAAFEGLNALKDLHRDGAISLYATGVITKNDAGEVSVREAADEGPVGTAVGMATGSVVGLLAGPAGVLVGASLGSLTGMLFDLDKAGIDVGFVEEVSKALTPGKAAVLADVEESWTTPVDTRIGQKGGIVFRRLRSEVVEDQMAREAAAFDAELREIEEELKQAREEDKAAFRKQRDDVKKKLQAINDHTKAKVDEAEIALEAKTNALKDQMKEASDRQKAKIEKRMTEVRADYEVRTAKLGKAWDLSKEALGS